MQLTQGIHRAVQLHPDRLALVCGDRAIDWATFADRVARLAGAFRALGVAPNDRVAMLAGNSDRYVEFYFATLWAGGVLVPINTRWSRAEMAACIDDCEPGLLVADAAHLTLAMNLRDECASVREVLLADAPSDSSARSGVADWESLIARSEPVADTRRSGEDLAALFYTGGTTGRAKGVMLSHANFMANSMMQVANLALHEAAVHLHVSPMFHVAGGARLFSVTVAGATHAVLEAFEPDAFLAAIERFRVTVTVVVPTVLNRLIDHPDLQRYDLSSLQLLSYGASPMPEAVLKRAMQRLPGIAFLQSYGMTELSPVATMLMPRYHTFDGPDAGYTRSAGQAVFNADIVVLDADDRALPTGAIGEICVRGPMVMQGYWRQPELTAQALRGGWMHTGDAGYIDSRGFVFLVDRVKDMIVTGGENVYSAEVENVIYQHPAVHECAVIGVPSDAWGEAVHAIVVTKPGTRVTPDELIAFCRQRIAHYKSPKSCDVRSEDLPKSGAGKILKADLRKPFWKQSTRGIN
jgi:long-chain acyl-CoA synthetase